MGRDEIRGSHVKTVALDVIEGGKIDFTDTFRTRTSPQGHLHLKGMKKRAQQRRVGRSNQWCLKRAGIAKDPTHQGRRTVKE